VLASLGELPLELGIRVEVILDCALRGARDENQLFGARLERLLHCVLDQGLVDDRQHFFRRCFGSGQKAGSPARNGEHDGSDRRHRYLSITL
jgi:hypothetical protein